MSLLLPLTLVVGAVPASAAAPTASGPPPAISPVDPAATPESVIARYSFNGRRSAAITDESGRGHTLHLVSAHGGLIHEVVHGAGSAISFPPECSAPVCPHVALQSSRPAADLNPGTRNIAFGADVLLPPAQTSKGENIVQKGYSMTSSQWKLQVDGRAGRPSCVLVGVPRQIRIAFSSVSIADGRWHAVQCRRVATTLAIFVDNVERGRLAVPVALSIGNGRPLSIGAKGAFPDNDQFNGALDNVWVEIG